MQTVIQLTDLGGLGFRISGLVQPTSFRVSDAGDANADGIDDFLVSGFNTEAYLIFGTKQGFHDLDLDDLSSIDGFVFRGDAGRPSSAGDVNGDGIADLILGSPGSDGAGQDAGRAYIIFGRAGGFEGVALDALAPGDGFIIEGDVAGDVAGASVSSAGDVNGDGFDDVIIGAVGGDDGASTAGEAYVVFGKAEGFGTVDLGNLTPETGFQILGAAVRDSAGTSVSAAGDVNGDGFYDVLVGAPNADLEGADSSDYYWKYADAGRAYLIFGKASTFDTVDLDSLEPSTGITIHGEFEYDNAGHSVSSAGDVNGDGLDDLIVGAPAFGRYFFGYSNRGYVPGTAYVIFGQTDGFSDIHLTDDLGEGGLVLKGEEPQDLAGYSVSSAGDINGDGFDDVIVGMSQGDFPDPTLPGRAFVVFGSAEGSGFIDLANLAPHQGFMIRGAQYGDIVGCSVSSAGDINGDGFDDIVVGKHTYPAEHGPLGPFGAFVIFGGDHFTPKDLVGTSASETLEGGIVADRLESGGGNDLLDGWRGDDYLDGGAGNDTATYRRAEAGVTVNLGLTGAQDTVGDGLDTLVSIENVTGSAFADRLEGNAGNNVLDGGAGDDRLRGNGGADTLIGGSGVDLAIYAGAARRVIVDLDLAGRQDTGDGNDLLLGIENLIGSDFSDQLTGNGGANTLNGGLGNDRLSGGGGADTLRAGAGEDILTGGAGADQMRGEAGHDVYYVDHLLDRVIEEAGGGYDNVHSSVSFTLTATLEGLFLTGSALRGTGNGMANPIFGNAVANILSGGGGDDRLSAGAGNDLLYGGVGQDRLAGGAGLDRFHFDTALNATTNLDQLLDFAAADDTIMLDRSVFAGLGANGMLAASAFRAGPRAADADDRIIYNSANGLIYYDADGLGGAAQVAFARVTSGTILTRADFSAYSSAATASAAQAPVPLFEDSAGQPVLSVLPAPDFRLDGPEFHIV